MVAPAGYSLTAFTRPDAWAAATSAGSVPSVRYSVISGSKAAPSGRAARIRSRYARASRAVTTGGTRLGMMIARAKWRALSGATARSMSPSRRCRCQSSGRRIVMAVCHALALHRLGHGFQWERRPRWLRQLPARFAAFGTLALAVARPAAQDHRRMPGQASTAEAEHDYEITPDGPCRRVGAGRAAPIPMAEFRASAMRWPRRSGPAPMSPTSG